MWFIVFMLLILLPFAVASLLIFVGAPWPVIVLAGIIAGWWAREAVS